MRSVADQLRRESARTLAEMSPTERIDLALRLGDDDVAMYRAAHDVSDVCARSQLARSRAVGRRPSLSNESDAQ